MLILCSNGISSRKLIKECRKHFTGCKTAALVVTADNLYKAENRNVSRCLDELKSLRLKTEIFDIDIQDPALLLDYDVVEFIGGNPFYLLKSIREHKCENILKLIAESKVLIGWSAAAFVFSPTLELVNKYSPELNSVGLSEFTALHLTDIEVLPHYSNFIKKFELFEERCSEYEKQKGIEVIRLNDGEGIFITEKVETIIKS